MIAQITPIALKHIGTKYWIVFAVCGFTDALFYWVRHISFTAQLSILIIVHIGIPPRNSWCAPRGGRRVLREGPALRAYVQCACADLVGWRGGPEGEGRGIGKGE
jgi:hypothetical protein